MGKRLICLHGDHLGSASLATTAQGGVVSQMRYFPYGETRSGDMATDRRYTGQRFEAGLGLYDYNARYYDPMLGRFISADTLVPNPGDPQSLNRYAYVRNNPLKYTDPSGHRWVRSGPDDIIDERTIGSQYGGEWGQGWTARDTEVVAWTAGMLFVGAVAEALVTTGAAAHAVEAVGWKTLEWVLGHPTLSRILGVGGPAAIRELTDGDDDEIQVAENLLELRHSYESEVRGLKEEAERRLAAGQPMEEVARWVHGARHALGVTYKNMTSPDLLKQIYSRNVERYGDPLGPSIEWLLEHGKTWENIIESAARPGGGDIIPKIIGH